MATRKEIHDEIAAAHERDKLAAEIYDTGYNEGKSSNNAAATQKAAQTYNATSQANNAAWQQNMAAFADAQKRAAAQLGEQLDAANLTGAGSAAIDRVRKYRQSTPGQTANMGQTANQAAVDKASKDLVSKDLMDEYLNRGKFSYDAAADPLYQQYRQQYLNAGQMAMKDTLGKATALTGGYGNSYANAVAQQTYDEYAAKAADKIPELYQLALDRYNQEGQDILNKYDLLHSREREAVEDERYQQEFDFKREQFDWSKLVDQHTMDLADKEFEESKNQFWANYDLKTKMYELDKWCKENQIQISWEELKQAAQAQSFDQAYKMLMYDYQKESDEKELAYKYYATDADNAYKYYAANLSNATNNRELDMRENGTYFDRTSGSTTPLVTIKTTEDRDKAVADTVQFMSNPVHTADDIDRFLDQYGDMGDMILALAEQKIADKDRMKYYNNSRLK